MSVYVFIIESANTEIFEREYENREVKDVKVAEFKVKMNIDNIEQMIEDIHSKFNKEVKVIFVDSQYQIKYYYSDEGKEEFENIQAIRNDLPQLVFHNCDWYQFLPHFEGIESDNDYVFATANDFDNEYIFANYLEVPLKGNCYFIWDINDIVDVVNAKAYYNIFSRILRNEQKDSLGNQLIPDFDTINWIIEEGCTQVQGLISSGCLQYQRFIQSKVDPWILNPYSIFSKGVIIETGLIPQPHPDVLDSKILKGLTIQEQFNEDAIYRYNLTDFMCRILSKYALEFGKISFISNYHQINYQKLIN